MSRYRPSLEEFMPFVGSAPEDPGFVPVDRRWIDAGIRVSFDRPRPVLLPLRERDRRREGRPVQLLGDRAVFAVRGSRRGRDGPDRGRRRPATAAGSRSADPFRELEELVARYRTVPLKGLPCFVGGAVGFASYDAVRYTEKLPDVPPDDRGIPDLSFAFYDRMLLFDHIRKTVLAVAPAHLGPGADPEAA